MTCRWHPKVCLKRQLGTPEVSPESEACILILFTHAT